MSKRRKITADELEPTEKLVSDGDLLLKNLLEKQLSKEANLQEELGRNKEFVSSTEYSALSHFSSGLNQLSGFENASKSCEEFEALKSAGLDDKDINFYVDSREGLEYIIMKHKNLDVEHVKERLHKINLILEKYHERSIEGTSLSTTSRHQTEFMLSIKPHSTETALLKFALDNEKKKHNGMISPMDSIKNIENEMMSSCHSDSNINASKIQKRVRTWKNRIESIEFQVGEPKSNLPLHPESFVKNSKWDIKTIDPQNVVKHNVAVKVYGCETTKSNHLFTIKDGKIVKVTDETGPTGREYKKLTVEEIKGIPKFAQYDPGIPSKILYIKNASGITASDLESLFQSFNFPTKSVKLLKGRMRGQAFVEFDNSSIAEQALAGVNGIIFKNLPLIIEFSKRTEPIK